MVSILTAIVNFFIAVGTLIVNFISGVFQMLQMLPSAISLLSYSVSMIPPVLVVFATAFISVSVVYLIIGR